MLLGTKGIGETGLEFICCIDGGFCFRNIHVDSIQQSLREFLILIPYTK